nr:MAG TPA: hypothetical protein [Caudoviricetes sp.]
MEWRHLREYLCRLVNKCHDEIFNGLINEEKKKK